MEFSIDAATIKESGVRVVSFGSGEPTGRQVTTGAQGAARNQTASPREVSSARSQIRRAQGVSQRDKRRLLQEIDDNATRRGGGIRRGALAGIVEDLRDLRG